MHSIVTLVKDPRLSAGAMGFEYIQWGSCIQLIKPPVHNLNGAQHSPSANIFSRQCARRTGPSVAAWASTKLGMKRTTLQFEMQKLGVTRPS